MKRIIVLSLLAIIWFFFVPIWDAMFNKNHLDAALVHFFTHTWVGGITMVVGLPWVPEAGRHRDRLGIVISGVMEKAIHRFVTFATLTSP